MSDVDIYRDDFVPNSQGFNKLSYSSWKGSNPGEAQKYEAFRDSILAGAPITPPVLTTKFGRMLVAAGKLVATIPVPEPEPPPTGLKLRDKPPGFPDFAGFVPVDLAGRQYLDLPDTQDTLLTIGDVSQQEGIVIKGGKRVVVRAGGHITATGSNRAAGVGLAITPRTDASHYYFEGLRIKPAKDSSGKWRRTMCDGIALRAQKGAVTFQNCLVGPVAVKEGFTSDDAHADVFQIQETPGSVRLRVDRFTGYTEYSGVMQSEFVMASQDWSRVNMVATGYSATDLDPLSLGSGYRGHTAFGVYYGAVGPALAHLIMSEFYWAKDPQQGFAGYSPPELVTQKGAKFGKPKDASGAERDYVTEADVKLPYQSPGYV